MLYTKEAVFLRQCYWKYRNWSDIMEAFKMIVKYKN